jgi:perosamine synthetase
MNGMHDPRTAAQRPIAVSQPDLSGRERACLLEAFDSSWISSKGPCIAEFETLFADFAGTGHAVTCVNGTAALHLALSALDLGPGDEVIVPTLTYVATANAVRYVGAEPVFADCDPDTWTLDPQSVDRLVTDRTRAVIAVHLHGVPCDMQGLGDLARRYGLRIVEDAAEAHGARFGGRPVGSLGDIATFSFYGNKIITTGEGGMVCTDDAGLAERVRRLRGQGVVPDAQYQFDRVGYNYRMTNLAAAIGLAQLERFNAFRRKREAVGSWYDAAIAHAQLPLRRQAATPRSEPVLWMYAVVLGEEAPPGRDRLRTQLAERGIETRPFFHPLHELPMYRNSRNDDGCHVSPAIASRGIMLPTHTGLTEADIHRVVDAVGAATLQPAGAA